MSKDYSSYTVQNLVTKLMQLPEFNFPDHMSGGGVVSVATIMTQVQIVETFYIDGTSSAPFSSASLLLKDSVAEKNGSKIIDIVKEAIYRFGMPEYKAVELVAFAFKEEGIDLLNPFTFFLSNTPKSEVPYPDPLLVTKAVEDGKRHITSLRSMKNAKSTRTSRKKAFLGLIRLQPRHQEAVLRECFQPEIVDQLGRSEDGYGNLVDLLNDIINDVDTKQAQIKNSIQDVHGAMKAMHQKPAECQHHAKPIHFLGIQHHQGPMFAPVHFAQQAVNYVWSAADAKYANNAERERAMQNVLSYIHRLSAEHQQSVLHSMGITEKDPRQAGIQVTELLENKIMGYKEALVAQTKPKVDIKFDPSHIVDTFSPTPEILTDPELAVKLLLEMFQGQIDNRSSIDMSVKSVCAFFTKATEEVKHEVLLRVYRINYFDTPADVLGRTVVSLTKEWLEKRYQICRTQTRNKGQSMLNQQTAQISAGDHPEMAEKLKSIFQDLGIDVQVVKVPKGGVNYNPGIGKSMEEAIIERKLVEMVKLQLDILNITPESCAYKAAAEELLQKAKKELLGKETPTKPVLTAKMNPEATGYSFNGFDAHGKHFVTISCAHFTNDNNAVFSYQHATGDSAGIIAAIVTSPEIVKEIMLALKHGYEIGNRDPAGIVHAVAKLTNSKIIK